MRCWGLWLTEQNILVWVFLYHLMNFRANPMPYLKNCLKVAIDEEMLDCAARCIDFFKKSEMCIFT